MRSRLLLFPLLAALAAPAAVPALGQDSPPLEPETVISEALRLTLDVETINSWAGWLRAGSRPQNYEMDTATTEGMIRPQGFRIQAKPDAERNYFGTLMRYAPAAPWRAKRVQLSARMKGENVDRLQLWLRADATRRGPVVAFYNMDDRPVRGSSEWRRYTAVLDIPEEAEFLAFGFFVAGRGVGWAEDFHVEEVGREVPVSRMPRREPVEWDRW